MKRIYQKIQIAFTLFLAVTTLANAQLKVESNGKIKIGTMPYSQFDSKFEITQHSNKPLETVLYSSSENISRLWIMNSLNAFGIGVNEKGLGQIYVYNQNPSPIMTFSPNGSIGLDKTPHYKLDVNGIVRVNKLIISPLEKLRYKVKPVDNQSKRLFMLNAISYQIQNNVKKSQETKCEQNETKRIHYGFVVSEVEELFPELIYKDEIGQPTIDYISLIPLLLNELKQQRDDIIMLKKLIDNINNKGNVNLNVSK